MFSNDNQQFPRKISRDYCVSVTLQRPKQSKLKNLHNSNSDQSQDLYPVDNEYPPEISNGHGDEEAEAQGPIDHGVMAACHDSDEAVLDIAHPGLERELDEAANGHASGRGRMDFVQGGTLSLPTPIPPHEARYWQSRHFQFLAHEGIRSYKQSGYCRLEALLRVFSCVLL